MITNNLTGDVEGSWTESTCLEDGTFDNQIKPLSDVCSTRANHIGVLL